MGRDYNGGSKTAYADLPYDAIVACRGALDACGKGAEDAAPSSAIFPNMNTGTSIATGRHDPYRWHRRRAAAGFACRTGCFHPAGIRRRPQKVSFPQERVWAMKSSRTWG
jgi:hypothetical protein